MIQAILFDLDDTLYPEADFCRGGFAAVAEELERRGAGPAAAAQELLESIHFREGRENVLDKASARLGFSAGWVPELVGTFRRHEPDLTLPEETAAALDDLHRRYRLGIVTDGHADVQRRKLAALGLAERVDAIMIADDLGREHWKPHPLPLRVCCRGLGVRPTEAVLVGDYPPRDMAAAARAGMASVRIRTPGGYFSKRDKAGWPRADFDIRKLAELEGVLRRIPKQKVA
jgi:putative hydrolase of the HAD superfamily